MVAPVETLPMGFPGLKRQLLMEKFKPMALAPRERNTAPTAMARIMEDERRSKAAVPASSASIKSTVGRITASSFPQTTGHPDRGTLFRIQSASPSRPKDCRAMLPLNMMV